MSSATDAFYINLGKFFANQMTTELMIDLAVSRLLNLSAKRTHVLTTGIELGKRMRWLREIIKSSKHPNKDAMLKALAGIQNDSKRNVFAHSYLWVDGETVTFVERNQEKVRSFKFTKPEFAAHVDTMANHGRTFLQALGVGQPEMDAFAAAAHRRR